MLRSSETLRRDALAIWQAGVDAVRSDRLVRQAVRIDGNQLSIGDEILDLRSIRRLVVVGAGKAGAGMARGLEAALGPRLLAEKQVAGLVNVPADCVVPLTRIRLHAARPAGLNEPTQAGVAGTKEILDLVGSLGPADVCVCLLSGGASALLPAPKDGISLADKQAVTRMLSAAGANIAELNTVRKRLSRIKGGGLARACHAGQLFTLIISDVLGDPLDIIGSGPTVPDHGTNAHALRVLERFGARLAGISPAVFAALAQETGVEQPVTCHVHNLVIGNNALAVDSCGLKAVELGYSPALDAARQLEGQAEEIGRHLARMAVSMRESPGPDCLISGGEPVVSLAPAAERGLGGRNQQLVLAALWELQSIPRAAQANGLVILSGGTDGEDGPTDAAGAFLDDDVLARLSSARLDAADYLRRNDAYRLFEATNGLIKTGPTHTNVCDVRVVLVSRVDPS